MLPYSYNKTITQLFEEAVVLYFENTAVYLDNGNVTYKQFNEDSNRRAHYLRAQGVTRNVIVAVEMMRSYEMLCSIFAIFKAGGVYLPISPDFPDKRKKQILEDAKPKFLIVDSNVRCATNSFLPILKLSSQTIANYSSNNLAAVNEPDDMAYVIYTSGSTGTPKGVVISHHSLVNRIEWMQTQFSLNAQDVLFHKTHCSFDVSIWEIFWWSISGAGVTLLPHGKENHIILMMKIILEKRVTVIHFVPTVFKIFLDYFEIGYKIRKQTSLKYIFSSGETLDVKTVHHFNRLFSNSEYPQLINLYGPTEATIDVTYFICDKNKKYREIPIGKPIQNVELSVMNESFSGQAVGQIGELYISGVCLAKGYLNNVEQQNRHFFQLPNSKRLYKTGDLVRWNKNGELCFVGRKDQQVKLNGIRVELGEIEHHLENYNTIAHAFVLSLSLSNHVTKKLVAFIKLKSKEVVIDIANLKSFLREQLPDYMIPNDYIIIDAFPFNKNGKLNREKLRLIYKNHKEKNCET